MTPGTVSQMSFLAGDRYLGPSVLLGFSCRHKRIVLSRQKRSGEAPIKHKSPGFVGSFFNCQGDESLGPVLFPAVLLPSWRHQEGEFPMSPTATGKVTFLPVPHRHEAGQIAKQG